MGRNRSGPPFSVGRPTAHAPTAGPPASSVTDDRRQRPLLVWPLHYV